MPIFFGPNYHNFQEAVDLVERKGVFAVEDQKELVEGIRRFADDEGARLEVGRICREYIQEKKGATGVANADIGPRSVNAPTAKIALNLVPIMI